MALSDRATIVLDTSVLLNFVRIDRMDLLLPLAVPLLTPDDVRAEVTRPDQRTVLEAAITSGLLHVESISNPAEVALFAELARVGRFGPGERAVMAVSLTRGMVAGLQERLAAAELRRRDKASRIVTTEDIVLTAIKAGAISVRDADGLLVEWRTHHRFASRIKTFSGFAGGN